MQRHDVIHLDRGLNVTTQLALNTERVRAKNASIAFLASAACESLLLCTHRFDAHQLGW
jgi:hypothetical protein